MKIELIANDNLWKQKYITEKNNIESILSKYNLHLEHIGSTALNDGYAKPIIDILIGIENERDIENIIDILINNDYIYYKYLDAKYPERKHLVRVESKTDITTISTKDEDIIDDLKLKRLFHLSITKYNSYYWKRHLAFRDFLLENKKDRMDYFKLKLKLTQKEWINMEEYSDAKSSFIQNIDKKTI